MKSTIHSFCTLVLLLAVGGWGVSQAAPAAGDTPAAGESHARDHHVQRLAVVAKPALDRTGRTRVGKASFYAKMFAGRTMADGTRMEPTANNAASRTLPLGTTAKVTNLETGKTAVVTIRDRGPYVAGRIVDLSPATARQIGLDKRTGVTRVEVSPIAVPLANGEVKLGDGVLQAKNLPDGRERLSSDERVEARTGFP